MRSNPSRRPWNLWIMPTRSTQCLKHKTEHEPESQRISRVSDEELFTRLLYLARQLHLPQDEFWLMPFGLMDLWEWLHERHFWPKQHLTIDDGIPDGI